MPGVVLFNQSRCCLRHAGRGHHAAIRFFFALLHKKRPLIAGVRGSAPNSGELSWSGLDAITVAVIDNAGCPI